MEERNTGGKRSDGRGKIGTRRSRRKRQIEKGREIEGERERERKKDAGVEDRRKLKGGWEEKAQS